MSAPPRRREPGFNLLHRLGPASLAPIAAIAMATGALLSEPVTGQFPHREARVAADFVQHVLLVDESVGFFEKPGDTGLARRFGASVADLRSMAAI